MKTLSSLIALGLIGSGLCVMAGNTAQQTVSFEVQAINEISVSGNPGALVISTATAGNAPDGVQDSSTSYAITSNESDRKITAQIDTAMAAGTTLKVNLAAPTGATSAGDVVLGTSASDVVCGISTLNESGKSITYKFNATSAAGVVSSDSKTVTFTVTAGS
ncbi:MAG: hypothetical protein JWO95_286 [Verrucomicrobiales bacterium]|nr:hypothetical protein [Verrucomicrobiales bacterium]